MFNTEKTAPPPPNVAHVYYVYINAHTCMYIFKKNMLSLYIKYIYITYIYIYIWCNLYEYIYISGGHRLIFLI